MGLVDGIYELRDGGGVGERTGNGNVAGGFHGDLFFAWVCVGSSSARPSCSQVGITPVTKLTHTTAIRSQSLEGIVKFKLRLGRI